jgi:phage tail sheath protein FI
VYVAEIPSGQQTIGGVATSITAFVGRTYRGPVNQATTIFSFADFQRYFGGLSNGYPLGFAVRDFFQNGGSQGIIVRVYGPEWLDYPVSQTQVTNAEAAAYKVNAQIGQELPQTSDAVTQVAESVAASYYGGELPEQYATANYMATQAFAWSSASDAASVKALVTYMGEAATVMTSGANAVVAAMQSPQSYNLNETAIASPPYPDDTSVVEVAQAAAAAQVPGPAQNAALLVSNAVQQEYDTNPAADYNSLVLAGTTAAAAVAQGLQQVEGVVASPLQGSADELLLDVVNAVPAAVKIGVTAGDSALILANAMLAQVLPAFQLATPPDSTSPGPLGGVYLNQLYDEDKPTSPAVEAALPPSTASVVVQAPSNFAAVAAAANSVAEAAWLTVLDGATSGMPVAQAASETAAFVKTNNPGLPQASAAAGAVSTAIAGALLNGAAAAAAAGTNAVAGAVASALQLQASNGAVVALASSESVALAGWQAAEAGAVDARAVTDAVNAAPSRSAAQATEALYTAAAGGTARAAALATSQGLVAATVSSLPSLTVNAANAGDWANGSLTVTFNTNGISAASVASMGLTPAAGQPPFSTGDVFNLQVGYTAPDGSTMSEAWNGVSLRYDAGAQRIDRVLANGSNLIQYIPPGGTAGGPYPTTPAPSLPATMSSGVAGLDATGTPQPTLQGTPSQPLQLEDLLGNQSTHTGIYALDHVDQFDLLCIPPDTQIETTPPNVPPVDPDDQWRLELYQTAAAYCQQKLAMLIEDPPTTWAIEVQAGNTQGISINDLGTYGPEGEYAAVYFPYLIEGNPLLNGQLGYFAPSGAMAGIMARTDAARGVWKAPAGINDGAISGTSGLSIRLSDTDSGLLNPQGINCLRTFPVYGNVVWGARTLKGADVLNNDYKYVPVRRLALYIEASLKRGLQWAVFEPNADPLWSSIRLSVNSFMNTLFRQGAFAGSTAKDAYFVACDATTTTQTDIEQGIVNVQVGFAPLLPAEFVVITIQQMAGQTPT